MKYCKNNLTFGRICPCGFRQLSDDYFYDPDADTMTEYCPPCREERKQLRQGLRKGQGRKDSPSYLYKKAYSDNIDQ
jgi:hypothetical protein